MSLGTEENNFKTQKYGRNFRNDDNEKSKVGDKFMIVSA